MTPEQACVTRAVAVAAGAQPAWAALPPAQRAAHLRRLRRVVVAAADRIAAVVGAETGRLAADTMAAEVMHAGAHLGWLARRAPAALAPERRSSWPVLHRRAWVERAPLGVAGVLSPANYPFLLALLPTATALAAGCTVVLKPSERAPRSGALVADLVREAGLPDGVLSVLQGGPELGAALVTGGVDVVSCTGSVGTGRSVAARAGEALVPTVLELGGNDPVLVLRGADLRRAARAAVWGACFAAGQSCVAVERVYVERAVADELVAALQAAFGAVGTSGRRDIGPLLDDADAERLRRLVDQSVAAGARLLVGGAPVRRDGRVRFPPTLLDRCPPDLPVVTEEVFGPILPVVRAEDEDEAVRWANAVPYGLGASVFAGDRAHGRRVAARLRAGMVSIDDCLVNYAVPALPVGGVGMSGWGRHSGVEGLQSYCRTTSFTELRGPQLPREPQWFPRAAPAPVWRSAARLLHGRR